MNLPNKLSFFRLFLIPFIFLLLYSSIEYRVYYATIVFLIACLTDAIDGYIARTRKEVTAWGKLMDPIADKILICSAFIALVELGRIPSWVLIIIIFREFLITGLRAVAASNNVIVSPV